MPKAPVASPISGPWSRPCEEILATLAVTRARGLARADTEQRRRRYGPNLLRQARPRSAWAVLGSQLASLMVALLAVAAGLSFLWADWIEGGAIIAVIMLNALIGFVTEIRAVRSMEALYRLGRVSTRVRRDGRVQEVPAADLVPGDIVLLEAGDVVTADLRLTEASKLQADESTLTGESLPVAKATDTLPADTLLPDRTNMLFKGTALTRGSGEGVVTAIGLDTELGRISALVQRTPAESTPLERRLERLGRRLIWVTLAIAAALLAGGMIAGKPAVLMIDTAIALAVAAIPEGLPVVATIALARGMWRMARHNALLNRLSAVETLGATSLICTDKTGTLTENRLSVQRLVLASGAVSLDPAAPADVAALRRDDLLREALETAVLCNNAALERADPAGRGAASGDPLEVALLRAGARAGLDRDALLRRAPEIREEAFDPGTKMMATFHRQDGAVRVAVKGAPEAVIAACSHVRTASGPAALTPQAHAQWLARNHELAEAGLRVLALAGKRVDRPEADPYERLELLGLVGLADPPRADVRAALDRCRTAGIRVVMVTGDQPVTARNIALAVGLVDTPDAPVMHGHDLKPPAELSPDEYRQVLATPVFARVSPEQKLDLIAIHQRNGAIVAMTGDGVNDAPALKKADIGIAMGQRGTQVAREAADMVLKDDAFSTIVFAVLQGRIILNNIRKFILYLLSCNLSEILVVGLAILANAPLPILPLQILFLNLVTDVFPALALGVGPGSPHAMRRPPRPAGEALLGARHWLAVAVYGGLITAAVLGAFALALRGLYLDPHHAVTVSFLTLAVAQLVHVFNMRDADSGLLANDITRNPYVWGALALCALLLLAAVYVPALADTLQLEPLAARDWVIVVALALLPWLLVQVSGRGRRAIAVDWRRPAARPGRAAHD